MPNLKYLPNYTIAISSINIGSVMEKSNYKKTRRTIILVISQRLKDNH